MNAILLPLGIIAFLILVNGVFVAAEFAVAGATHTRMTQMAETGSIGAQRVLTILRSPRLINRYLSTAQVGITLASLGLGMYGEETFAEWIYAALVYAGLDQAAVATLIANSAAIHTVASVGAVIGLTYLHVVLGEMAPKSLALQGADATAVQLSGFMALMDQLFRPLTSLLTWSGEGLLRLAGMPPADASQHMVSSVELAYIVEESTEGGLLEPEEQVYLENVLDFHERTIGQVMTPRTRMQAVPSAATLDEVLALISEHHYSRYPVYTGDRDHIVGVLHVKDLARQLSEDGNDFGLATLMRPAVFAPETLALEQMLQRFRHEHIQVAIVVDEFGGTAGLVTLEDLVEELIGEIQDESDQEIAPFEEIAPNTLRVRGDLLLDELKQHYELDLEYDQADTVGGLIMALLGHVAQPGAQVTYMNVVFEVESVEGLAVNTAILHLPNQPDNQLAEGENYD
jgi:CBS domain containing-hemolysin-like protein